MIRFTRNFLLLNRPKLKLAKCVSRAFSDKNKFVENDQRDDSFNDSIEFSNELIRQAYKDELNEFKNDLEMSTLSECLRKYECSIEDALKLDPEEQKRIIIKGLVIAKFISLKAGRVKLKLWDINKFVEITVMMPDHVYKLHSENLGKGSWIVLTGLVFANKETKVNSFFCDKIVYCNQTDHYYVSRLYQPTRTINDWFILRNYPSMKFRSHRIAGLAKLRSSLVNQIHKMMQEEKFVHVTPPILTSWPLMRDDAFIAKNKNLDDYFSKNVYLNKESDKHLESIVNAIPQIYTINHSFSADERRSRQTVSEKLMLEVAQFADDKIDDLMDQVEYFVKKLTSVYSSLHPHIIDQVKGKRGVKAEFRLENLDFNYIRMTYDESIGLLKKKEIDLAYGEELTFLHKKIISDYFQNYPIFIYNFPYELKNDFDTFKIDEKAQRFELLIGSGLSGGKGKIKAKLSSAETEVMLNQLNADENFNSLVWYLDLKRKGSVPSTWFSLSIDLYLMAFLDLPSLRDAILFPRVPKHCEL